MTDDDANLTLEEIRKIEASIARIMRDLNKMTALIGSIECRMEGIEHGVAEMQTSVDRLDQTLSRMERRLDEKLSCIEQRVRRPE